jgi:hypothetical protein
MTNRLNDAAVAKDMIESVDAVWQSLLATAFETKTSAT